VKFFFEDYSKLERTLKFCLCSAIPSTLIAIELLRATIIGYKTNAKNSNVDKPLPSV
jgi:hypothetical protein